MTTLSLISGLISAVSWMIGDIIHFEKHLALGSVSETVTRRISHEPQ